MAFDGVNAALILSKGVGCPPNDMQSFNATSQEDGIKITFTGPKNSYVFGAANNDTLLSTPAGVMIRYSDTDYPADINDGTLLGVYNENYNPVNPTEVTDNLIGLVFEQTYYFSAFPFSVDGIYNKSQAPTNRASCQWVGNKGTINVTVATYEGYTGGEIGEYTITLVDQASSGPQNIQRTASGTGLTQIGNLEEGKTYVVTLTDVGGLTCDPSEPITIVAGETYNVTMTYREKYGTISVTVTTANDAFALGEYKITLLDQASESPQNIEKQANGKTTTVFENLIAGKQYKVRLGPATNWIAPVDSDTLTVLGGDDVAITMTYSPGFGSVVVNVTTNPTGMPIGSYTITLTPTAGGSPLQQSRSGSGSITFNSVPIGTYNITGSSISHYTFRGGQVSVTGGQQSSHNVYYAYSDTLEQASWSDIQTITKKGYASSVWSVGDTKTIQMPFYTWNNSSSGFVTNGTNRDVELVLVKTTSSRITFFTKDAPLLFRVWYGPTTMMRWIMEFDDKLPSDLQAVLVNFTGKAPYSSDGTIAIQTYENIRIAPLSLSQIGLTPINTDPNLPKFPYFTSSQRRIVRRSDTGATTKWATCSIHSIVPGTYTDYDYAAMITSNGNLDSSGSNGTEIVPLYFEVG